MEQGPHRLDMDIKTYTIAKYLQKILNIGLDKIEKDLMFKTFIEMGLKVICRIGGFLDL